MPASQPCDEEIPHTMVRQYKIGTRDVTVMRDADKLSVPVEFGALAEA